MDNYYPIEIRLASKNAWFTPDEAKRYYGRYSRQGISVHWWGGGEPASRHDGIVNYFLQQALAAVKSVNYVVSDNKITMMVNPDQVAWCTQSGNPTTVSIEFQPTLGAEGYKKAGWLIEQLEQRYGHELQLYPHKFWFATSCPGTLSLDRMRQEANKWARGEYTNPPVPVPPPTPPAPTPPPPPPFVIDYHAYDVPRHYVVTKEGGCDIWDFGKAGWNFTSKGRLAQGQAIDSVGYAIHPNGATYIMTAYSYNANPRKTVGVNINDVQQVIPSQPTPPEPIPPTPVPEIPPPPTPEWVANLKDVDDTKYWVKEDTFLIDITTGKPALRANGSQIVLAKDSTFVSSALTEVSNVEYRITDYSFKKKIFNGVPIDQLTLTPPGIPDIPPIPQSPTLEETKSFLQSIVDKILEFLAKF